jgi:peroxiredoxin Q/BCP
MAITTDLPARETPLEVGETAPDFTLFDTDRNEVTLDSLLASGRELVLSFFPFAFTSVCSSEMECFSADKALFEGKNANVVGVSCDSFAANGAFAEKHGVQVPLLCDMHRAVTRAFGIHWPEMNVSKRATFIIGPDKKVRWVSVREPGEAVENKELLGVLS